ncbi:30S ribosomal protein S15 [Enterobacteriaceae endosymbiont of Donacia bicoloricornis]|uniref:30S ribosomal protein S15 n=1 Tax=Enterobacteriaceae endosymbiont of Donacia bicoloricornis TaxID=2675772 RepID=UPI001448B4F5|nr:30S ribosomal protein S15 [Enterobacteriaceae endosymbiont of Donacia bicoloricornis]QJC37823.1 30S ribosomal protein S15 [Enterobacteriaceae endosymbiont of Donacia bicoloricornis]
MYFNTIKKTEIIKKYKNHNTDKGSTKIQIALLTFKINYLHKHFAIHKKDHHSRRGLLNMISKRRKLLNYLKKKKLHDYNILIENLGLRK